MTDRVCAIASLPVCFGECFTIVGHGLDARDDAP